MSSEPKSRVSRSRWLFTVFAGFSGLLCLLAAVLWVESYWFGENVLLQHLSTSSQQFTIDDYFARSKRGRVGVGRSIMVSPLNSQQMQSLTTMPAIEPWNLVHNRSYLPGELHLPTFPTFEWHGFLLDVDRGFYLIVPHWSILAVTAVAPAWWLVLWYRRVSRAKVSLCERCGYNLTGNTSGVCPECGERV